MYVIPIMISLIPPNIVAIFPIRLFIFFPNINPIYVSIELVSENISAAII